jgi:oligopeptide/dipeptide ABC transporter ATP-binding protein
LPTAGTRRGDLRGLGGTVPDLLDPPPGCRFASRCPAAASDCAAGTPPMRRVGEGHEVACLHPDAA